MFAPATYQTLGHDHLFNILDEVRRVSSEDSEFMYETPFSVNSKLLDYSERRHTAAFLFSRAGKRHYSKNGGNKARSQARDLMKYRVGHRLIT